MPVGVVRLTEPMECLSSAVLNGGDSAVSAFFIMQVSKDYNEPEPAAHAARVRDGLGLPEDTMGMMTAAEVDYVFNMQESTFEGETVAAVATAGLSNHVVAGEVLEDWPARHEVSMRRAARMMAGTINTVLVCGRPLTVEGKVNILLPIVEAKSAALADRGFQETGTTSDAVAVISPKGEPRVSYTGTGSDIGIAAARAVRSAIGRALEVRGERPVPLEPRRLLEKLGYDERSLYAMSGTDLPEDRFRKNLDRMLDDPRTRTVLDMAVYISNRADSLAADGDGYVGTILGKLCGDLCGQTPEPGTGFAEGVVMAMAARAGRCGND